MHEEVQKKTKLDLKLEQNPLNAATLTSTLINQVTTTLTNVNIVEVENRIKEIVVNLLSEPLNQVSL